MLVVLFELLPLLLVLAVVLGVAMIVRDSRPQPVRPRPIEPEEMAAVQRTIEEDITVFGEDLQRLDTEVSGALLDEGARADYQRALDAYDAAKKSSEHIEVPTDARHVAEILDEGRYAIACVSARVSDQPPPARRPACFFDPRHGQSVATVTWAPPGGTPRDVPVCNLDAERVRAGADPAIRHVMVGPRRMPYYQAGPAFAPMTFGYFGGFGVLSTLFAGTALGSAIGDPGQLGDGAPPDGNPPG